MVPGLRRSVLVVLIGFSFASRLFALEAPLDLASLQSPLAGPYQLRFSESALLADPLRQAAARAKQLHVPFRVQQGPTCGLYALGMVMDFYARQNLANLTAYVFASDAQRADAATLRANTDRLLFDVARASGYFQESLRLVGEEGGMFVADQLGQLAKQFGYDYRRVDNAGAADIRAAIDRGHPALLGYDADYLGNPGLFDGKRAHWCVIVGYFDYQGEPWVIAQHGWAARQYLWRAAALEASMRQIQPTLGPKIIEVLSTHLLE